MHRLVFAIAACAGLSTATICAQKKVAHFWVDAKNGLDTNAGTRAKPFKTITKAVKARIFDSVVHLLPGTYGPKTNGDFWDSTANKGTKIQLQGYRNFRLVGEDRATCIIDFNGIDTVWYGLIDIRGATTDGVEITNLTFKNVGIGKAWGCGPINTNALCKNVNIHGNLFVDTGSTFISWGGFDIAFHDNVITSTTANKGKFVGVRVRTRYGSAANGDRTYIYNNVIYNANHGISWNARNPGAQFICNNIVLDSKIGFPGSTPVKSVVMQNNIAFNNTTDWAYTRPPSNLVVDPKLVDPAKGDFRQKAGSPCREGGYAVALHRMANDYFGNARVHDADADRKAIVDIGIQEIVDTTLTVSKWGQGMTPVFSQRSPTNFAGPALFFFAADKIDIAVSPFGSFLTDPGKTIFVVGTRIPAQISFPVPKDSGLDGLVLYAQTLGLRPVSGGLSWKPSGRLRLEL